MLVDHALARFSTDNLSCMIVRLDKAKEPTTAAGVGLGLSNIERSDKAEGGVKADEDVVMSDAVTPAPAAPTTSDDTKG